jgi:hypothetical protein
MNKNKDESISGNANNCTDGTSTSSSVKDQVCFFDTKTLFFK